MECHIKDFSINILTHSFKNIDAPHACILCRSVLINAKEPEHLKIFLVCNQYFTLYFADYNILYRVVAPITQWVMSIPTGKGSSYMHCKETFCSSFPTCICTMKKHSDSSLPIGT